MTAWKSLVPASRSSERRVPGHAEVQDAEPALAQIHQIGRMRVGVHEAVVQHLPEPTLSDVLGQ